MRTPKARALGRALRQAREESRQTLRAFAVQLGRDPGVLSRWETGDRTPQVDQVAQILTLLGVNGERYEEIIALTRGTDEPRWLAVSLPEQRQQFEALLDLEQSAATITEVSPLLVPGLLQSTAYIKAIMNGGSVPPGEIAARVAIRIGRKEVLTRPEPVRFGALIGEAALRQLIGDRAIMVEQLRHLLDLAGRSNVDLQVVPYDSGWHPGLEGPFILIEPEQATPVVQLENRRSLLFLHEEEDVEPYQQAVEMVRNVAMSPADSTGLIAEYVDRWEKQR